MRIAVITCEAYRDTWHPFFQLFRRFWPDCQFPISLVTDSCSDRSMIPDDVEVRAYGKTWCGNFGAFALEHFAGPILMLQDDFFLNAPVNLELIHRGINLLRGNVGAVRLYPCPGADSSAGDAFFGPVDRGNPYFVSCQASVWDPGFVQQIAANDRTGLARDFELDGTLWARRHSSRDVLAFRREKQPWPISYMCTAIVRGKYLPEAKALCDKYSITVDWSRGFQAA